MKKLELEKDVSVIKITPEQAEKIGIDISKDEIRGEIETWGPWHIPVRYKAICIDDIYEKNEWGQNYAVKSVIYGKRTLTNLRQSGYEMEGWVSVEGKKYTAFTSSQLFEIDGKLIDVATMQVRKTPMPK